MSDAGLKLKSVYDEIQSDYKSHIEAIFAAKCAACHSANSTIPWYASLPIAGWIVESDRAEAKKHIEISNGFPFAGHGEVDEDLRALKKTIEKDAMPTRFYRIMHPSSGLNEAEKFFVLEWIEGARSKISQIKTESSK